jgi:hypothetical protein
MHFADRLKDALQLAALFLVVGRQQQAAFWGLSGHGPSFDQQASYPQPNREVIPRGLRENINVQLLLKIKFERVPETEGVTGMKKPPEDALRRLVFFAI